MFGFFYKERFYTICYYKIVQNYFRNCKEITYPFWLVLLPFFCVSNFAKRRKLLATICALKKNKITTPILYTLFLYNSL
jgi:hypothetical protein